MSTITVVGLGYMGLPMASVLATNGHKVLGVDISKKRVEALRNGECPFEEPGLPELIEQAFESGNLTVDTSPAHAEFYILAVPTPFVPSTKTVDLSAVRSAAESIAPVLKKGDVVILESTVPPKATEGVVGKTLEALTELKLDKDFFVAHCPERAFPGKTLEELVGNDRIIGCDVPEAAARVEALYSTFSKGNLHTSKMAEAEATKVLENTYRDINIALANEFAKISEELGINAWEVIRLANYHPRVNVHFPGPGVGGHCIAIDPWFLAETSDRSRIIPTARAINDGMPLHVTNIVTRILEPIAGARNVTLLGVAYKADVDDSRETPAEHVATILNHRGFTVRAHDPHVKSGFHNLERNLEEAVRDADCLVLTTNHSAYLSLDPEEVGKLMRTRVIVDTRNHLNLSLWQEAGFAVHSLGNGRI